MIDDAREAGTAHDAGGAPPPETVSPDSVSPDSVSPEVLREAIAVELLAARARTAALTDCVEDHDLTAQHSPLMSPLVWDLAHIGNQEELWLLRNVGGRDPMHPEIDPLYDAFQHPRAERPALPLLPPAEARAYAGEVRGRVLDLLAASPLEGAPLLDAGFAFGMIAQHEQQHDETMLITHQLRRGEPALAAPPPPPAPADAAALPAEVLIPAGPFTMGTDTEPWALDNERPAHRVDLPAYRLDTTPVTNAAYLRFLADGGYDEPHWWTPEGWAHRQSARLSAPLFWQHEDGQWLRRRFGVLEPVPLDEPVLHVSWYEADAYARWAGRRLPTEAEWEKAARHDPATGRSRRYPWGDGAPGPEHANLGQRHLRPAPAGSYPDGRSPYGVRQLMGDVWEWTASDLRPYPGFRAWPYREYSEVFFGPEYKVLRGGCFAVAPVACRGTFRNWDYPVRRQIFAGFRTAADVDAGDGGRPGAGGAGGSGRDRSGAGAG
ncbi:ergothioneine biosynthesis protein EgtB [Kitasatospora sp. NPDC058032]|uniref:ergothioneine biosynthesis protein EgtB n=1 Tax=Kitasatospora sp. NPDC058032 TaxID=3346307 RepID=UPI0036DD38B0